MLHISLYQLVLAGKEGKRMNSILSLGYSVLKISFDARQFSSSAACLNSILCFHKGGVAVSHENQNLLPALRRGLESGSLE